MWSSGGLAGRPETLGDVVDYVSLWMAQTCLVDISCLSVLSKSSECLSLPSMVYISCPSRCVSGCLYLVWRFLMLMYQHKRVHVSH